MPGGHAGPGLCDLVGEDGVFPALLHAPRLPFGGELVADADGEDALVDPVGIIALLLVGLQRPVDGLFRVDGLLDALPAYGGEPEPEGFCLRRGDRLDDAQDLFRIGGKHLSLFACGAGHFYLGTICPQVACELFVPLAHFFEIIRGIGAVRQHRHHIHHGEIPFFLFLVPGGTDLSIFKKLDGVIFVHGLFPPLMGYPHSTMK